MSVLHCSDNRNLNIETEDAEVGKLQYMNINNLNK